MSYPIAVYRVNMTDVDEVPFDGDSIQWTKATSKNGASFEYGVKKTEIGRAIDRAPVGDTGDDTESGLPLPVHWPLGDKTWIPVSLKQITQYRLYRNSWSYYDYILEFMSTGDYSFTFWDESGDYYTCTTIINGLHSVAFNSLKPSIVAVQ